MQVHLTNFILLMFVLSDLKVVMDVTINRTLSLLECYLIAFAGVVAGRCDVDTAEPVLHVQPPRMLGRERSRRRPAARAS